MPVITHLFAGEDAVSGGTCTVLLPVEEDGATRRVCQQDSTGEEEVYSTSRSHVSLDLIIPLIMIVLLFRVFLC